MSKRALVLPLALAVAALGIILPLLLRPDPSLADAARAERESVTLLPVAERRALPAWTAPALDPPPSSISSARLRGRPTFIEVWASWCPSCREGAPGLARLARRYGALVRFVGIDVQDELDDGRAFVRRYGLRFPHAFDPDATLAAKLRVLGVPTAILVDSEGRIAATLIGRKSEETLGRYLDVLVSEAPLATAGDSQKAPPA